MLCPGTWEPVRVVFEIFDRGAFLVFEAASYYTVQFISLTSLGYLMPALKDSDSALPLRKGRLMKGTA